jgi:aminoglycoside phosphotransferase (APT) family kinase protein
MTAPSLPPESRKAPAVADGEDSGMTMPPDHLHVDAQTVRRLVEVQFPQWRGVTVTELRTPGTVNAFFRIGDDLAARFPLVGHDPARTRASLATEAEAARELADAATVPPRRR